MSEKVLTVEVIKLRKKKIEADTPQLPKEEEVHKPSSLLEQNYYNLMQLAVRYGERPIQVDETVYSIGDLIFYTLEGDGIKPPMPVYQTMIDEFRAHSKEEGFKAETFFKFHPNAEVSKMAIDMIAEKYRDVTQDNEKRLGELVARLLFEIKLTVINMQVAQLEEDLKAAQAANDVEQQMTLLGRQPELLARRNEICKRLGNRVINI